MEQRPRWLYIILIITLIGLVTASMQAPSTHAAGTITGIAFRDFNANGVNDIGEVGQAGVTVTAYDSSNAVQGTTTTVANGTYTLTTSGAGPYRIAFSGWPNYLQPAAVGKSNSSSLQFVPDGSATVNFGLNDPAEFCQDNPELCTSEFINGDRNDTTSGGQTQALLSFPYSASGKPPTAPTQTSLATKSAIGTVWGLAYARVTKTIYSAAFLRRHADLGPNGLGAIYQTAINGTSTSLLVDLAALGINVGTINASARGLGAYNGSSNDPEAYDKVGAVGLGGLAISTDQRTLWVMNLNDRTLYSVAIDADTNPATMPVAADVAGFAVPDPGCTGGTYRPFAVNYYHNDVYVGVVCDAQTSQNVNDLQAFIYKFTGGAFVTTPVLSFGLNYPKGAAESDLPACPHGWLPWNAPGTVPGPCYIVGADQETTYPQPLLSGIAFDIDGSMMLSFMDRYSAQTGYVNADPNGTQNEVTIAGGDLLRAYNNNGTFVLENNGVVGPNIGSSNNGQGPGNGEFYRDNSTDAFIHEEVSAGAVAFVPGSSEVVITAQGTQQSESGGVSAYNNTNGQENRSYLIYDSNRGGTFGKAAGLGDLEVLCSSAPVEIGNRVWRDTNNNGIQEAGELPIAGITVHLYALDGVTVLATAVTDANGTYYFSNGTGTTTTNAIYNITGLIFNTTGFQIRLDNPADYATGGPLEHLTLTKPNVQSGDSDLSGDTTDSDGILADATAPIGSGNYPTKSFNLGSAGYNNHTYDFGFFSPGVVITKLVNGADANDPNGADVPMLAPGQIATWTYRITNTGTSNIARADISVSDSVVGNLMRNGVLQTLAAPYTGAIFGSVDQLSPDDVLAPGEVFELIVTWIVPDFSTQNPDASTTDQWVRGCGQGSITGADRGVAYENIGIVTIPGSTASDAAYVCNPPARPSAITLSSFGATWQGTTVVVQWTTTREFNTFGFHVLRSTDGMQDHASEVTPAQILGQGRGRSGASYIWNDSTVSAGQTYSYWLEETEVDGSTNIYGPTRATAPGISATYRVLLPVVQR